MGAVCQIALDIPPEIVDGLAAGIMTRSGSVVRNSAGQIVAHLKEAELGSDRVADKMAKAAAAAWRTTHGKVVIIGCVSFLSARLWVLGKERYERKQKSQQLIDEFNAACSSYLNVARQAVLNVDVIHDLSEVTQRIQELPSKERPVFSPQIVDLIEEHTRELAEANNVVWTPIESTDDDLFARLVYSLETQRQIFDNAA
ncbi:MAG: hypothetical protein ACFNUK_00680 [Schaalia sp.]